MPPEPLGNRTKMESTAALLPKQGSRAIGFGTDCGRKQREKEHYNITSRLNLSDHRSFAVTVLVCVSSMQRKKNLTILSRDKQTDLQSQIRHTNPHTVCVFAACTAAAYQTQTLAVRFRLESVYSSHHGLCDIPDSLIPISPVYQHLIHMWR